MKSFYYILRRAWMYNIAMRKLGVILLSGGLDSTTVAAWAAGRGFELSALTFRYGQKHSKEVGCAQAVARRLGIKHRVVDASFLGELAWYSALTGKVHEVPKGRRGADMASSVPATYVPMRNTVFISMAAAMLESEALALIETSRVRPADIYASILIAANAIDYSGYPDCRPEYYEQMEAALKSGSKLGTIYGRDIKIETPIIDKTKSDIVRMALQVGAPLNLTWSCYEGGEAPCGACDSCLIRAKGFAEAGVSDPLLLGGKRP